MERQPKEEAPTKRQQEDPGGRFKNFTRAGIVAAGALLSGDQQLVDKTEIQHSPVVHQDVGVNLSDERIPVAPTVGRKSREASPEYLRGMEILNEDTMSWNESSKLLDRLLGTMDDEEERVKLLKAFAEKNVTDFPQNLLVYLEARGIDVVHESWVIKVFEQGFLKNPESVVSSFFPPENNGPDGESTTLRAAEIYSKWRDVCTQSTDPRIKAALDILEHDGPETDPRLFLFLDEIGSKQLSTEDVKLLIADPGKLFTQLSRKAIESGVPSSKVFEVLEQAAGDDMARRDILKLISGYDDWKAQRDSEASPFFDYSKK